MTLKQRAAIGSPGSHSAGYSPDVLRGRRLAWGCDCGGDEGLPQRGGELAIIERMRKGIADIIGEEPPTCPWRTFTDPLVRDVMGLLMAYEKGNLAVVAGTDPPDIWLEGLRVFTVAKDVMISHIEQKRHEQRERERKRRG